MSQTRTEINEQSTDGNAGSCGIDSLGLVLLTAFLNQLFVQWAFFRPTISGGWLVMPGSTIFFSLWWFGVHILLFTWVVIWLFRGRIQIPLAVYGVCTLLATACGVTLLSGSLGEGKFTIIGPACFFLSNLLAVGLLTRERRFELLVQVFLSSIIGLGSGLLYLYLYLTSI